LDVIVGVWSCLICLPICFDVSIPEVAYWALPLSTWAIYLTDHLIDVFRNKNEYPTPRHQFIKKYFRLIIVLIIIISLVDLYLLIKEFNTLIFFSGIALVIFVLLHFILVRINPQIKSFINNKEFAVASIYATGIYFAPLFMLYCEGRNYVVSLLCFLMFFTLALINLLMVSIIEFDYDKQMGNTSWVISISKPKAGKIFFILVAIIIISGLVAIPFIKANEKLLVIVYQLMAIGHFVIFMNKQNLKHYLAYRKLSEILFWLPGLILFLF